MKNEANDLPRCGPTVEPNELDKTGGDRARLEQKLLIRSFRTNNETRQEDLLAVA